jgi:hypothetical protein
MSILLIDETVRLSTDAELDGGHEYRTMFKWETDIDIVSKSTFVLYNPIIFSIRHIVFLGSFDCMLDDELRGYIGRLFEKETVF